MIDINQSIINDINQPIIIIDINQPSWLKVGHLKALLQTHPTNRADVNVMMQPSGLTAIHMAAERGLSEGLR